MGIRYHFVNIQFTTTYKHVLLIEAGRILLLQQQNKSGNEADALTV